jgi:hypothetical protein
LVGSFLPVLDADSKQPQVLTPMLLSFSPCLVLTLGFLSFFTCFLLTPTNPRSCLIGFTFFFFFCSFVFPSNFFENLGLHHNGYTEVSLRATFIHIVLFQGTFLIPPDILFQVPILAFLLTDVHCFHYSPNLEDLIHYSLPFVTFILFSHFEFVS